MNQNTDPSSSHDNERRKIHAEELSASDLVSGSQAVPPADQDVPASEGLAQQLPFEPSAGNECPTCKQLLKRLAEIEAKTTEADTLYKRMAADFENYRKRIDRERQEFQTLGVQKAVEALLPALDDLDRAQASLAINLPPESLLESIKLVFNRINQSLEQIDVKPISTVGEHFDLQFHEPIQQVETTDVADGAVAQVLRKGYTLNGKVVRPALVTVASNKTFATNEDTSGG